MTILLFLIPLSVFAATCFLVAFVWAVRAGQYDDTCTPALRPLMEDQNSSPSGKEPRTGEIAKNGPNEGAKIAKE